MKSAPSEPPDLVIRLRQQLILAQVRIMELEDERDCLAPRLTELAQLLAAAQSLADRKIDEAAHLEKVLAGLQEQGEQLRQLLQQAGQELASLRATLAKTEAGIVQRQGDVNRLEAELLALKSSRSWRWTAWWRAFGEKSGDHNA